VQSYQVLRAAIDKKGAKAVSAHLQLSPSMIYKWCQSKPEEGGDGVENPLDRLLAVVKFTEDDSPIHWLCHSASGFFVTNPIKSTDRGSPVLQSVQKLLREFSELLEIISESYNNDSVIDNTEAERIRTEWERLKTLGEGFVCACEEGDFATPT
jgi:hypothetical protein